MVYPYGMPVPSKTEDLTLLLDSDPVLHKPNFILAQVKNKMLVSFLSWFSLLGTKQTLYFCDKLLTVQIHNMHSMKFKNWTDLDNSIFHYIQTYNLNFHLMNSGTEQILIMRNTWITDELGGVEGRGAG